MSRRKHLRTLIIEPAEEGIGGKAATACGCVIEVHDTTTDTVQIISVSLKGARAMNVEDIEAATILHGLGLMSTEEYADMILEYARQTQPAIVKVNDNLN